jgi:hypothetical protein
MSELESLEGNFVGVIPPISFRQLWYVKQLLLMFDKLALDLGHSSLPLVERRILENAKKEIKWLNGKGFLTTLSGLAAGNLDSQKSSNLHIPVIGEDLLAPVIGRRHNLMGRVARLAGITTIDLRLTASELRTTYGVDAVAVPSKIEPQSADATADRDAVVRIVLREFPTPSNSTPWENIEEFHRDDAARTEFHRLKQWINKTGKAGLKQYEVTDELRELIYTYAEGIKAHRIKAERGILEVLVTTTAEIAEGLVKGNFSTAAKALFEVSKHKIKLLEEERETPGREVAYIVTARSKFTNS